MRAPSLFKFCPQCASPVSVGSAAVSLECPRCGLVYFFNPTVSAAAIVADRQGAVILIRRNKNPQRGKFGLPGGFVDFDESAESAVRREIVEEIGIEVLDLSYLRSFTNTYHYKGVTYRVLDLFFQARVDDFSRIEIDPSEISDVWVGEPSENELEEMAFESNRRALELFISGSNSRGL